MKRILIMLMAVVMLLSFSACSTDDKVDADASEQTAEQMAQEAEQVAEDAEQTVEVDEGLLDVTITLPAVYFEDEDMTSFDEKAYANEQGFKKAVLNDDGSVSITMTKKKHNEMMDEFRSNIDAAFADLVEAEDTPYIKNVTSSDDYREVIVDVDRAGYESAFMDLTPFMIGMMVMMYQQYDSSEQYCQIVTRDAATQEEIASVVYPDAWDDVE